MKRIFGIGLALAFLAGCKSENADPEMGYEFYPATINSWISYSVDSIWYAEGAADTFHYEIKELIESEFTDDEGRSARRIERFFRLNNDQQWVLKDIWKVIVTKRKVEKVEENIRFVRLNFPVNTSQYWDGNALNNLERWDYSYAQVGESQTFSDTYFPRTATVNQEGAVNLIEQERGQEVYAADVGLVYKHLIEIQTDISYTSNPVPENIQSGYELYYHYLDHGQN